ncbi:Fe(2+) transporter permease subunit FeoB [Legionella dresdenensis]|uniref:Ferrous iron transport protein B n=1 Tax=Legionella dresdenensis TaxID=450200 RepID=A0ABV8CFX7_9GAMM
MTHILLAGNPNCGKTTLFNALTGDNQRVGNWPGVTVEKKTGRFSIGHQHILVTDLPGVYSLTAIGQGSSQDERIAASAVKDLPADMIINVIDACHLERHLYLTSQLLELGKPVVIALNMIDIAEQRGISIDVNRLSRQLNCPVIPIQAHKKTGISALLKSIASHQDVAEPMPLAVSEQISRIQSLLQTYLVNNQSALPAVADYTSWRAIEGDTALLDDGAAEYLSALDCPADADISIADARYGYIHQLVSAVQKKNSDASEHFTARVDRIVLHRYWALPIFLGVMYLMFLFAINIGGAFQDFFDIATDAVFVQGSAWLLSQIHTPQWIIAIVANGIGVGINTTLTFIPVIAAMFFFLSLLEASGYMARAAFVVDKIMRVLGLPGKSFVPMIVGFGCNVPAIMAARTLDSERDRLLTVLMAPFMSCSARLAIYAVFVAAFFPVGGQNIVFSLYLIGIAMAVLTGFLLRKTSMRGQTSPLILELPAYHRPSLKRLCRETGLRLRHFIIRAGRLIIPICVLLGGLNALTIDGGFSADKANTHSVLSLAGQWLTPIFSPMGLHQDNWPATVGLLTGMLAKEVVVGTLNSLYAQLGHLSHAQAVAFDFWGSLKEACWSVPHNFAELGQALINPIQASAPDSEVSKSVYGMMAARFDGKIGAYAYMLFILLYIPCVSTMAVIRQEASRRLMWFSVAWSLLLAYACAVIFYQIGTFSQHPEQSLLWCGLMITGVVLFIAWLRNRSAPDGGPYAISHP